MRPGDESEIAATSPRRSFQQHERRRIVDDVVPGLNQTAPSARLSRVRVFDHIGAHLFILPASLPLKQHLRGMRVVYNLYHSPPANVAAPHVTADLYQ